MTKALAKDLPNDERPLSEQFRLVAKAWVELHAAATLLEDTKSAVLSRLMMAEGEMPVSHAERNVKSSPAWVEHVTMIVEARKAADLKKVQMEYLRMKFAELQSREATERREFRMSK